MMSPKRRPERTCIGCGQSKEKQELIRIIRTPEGRIVAPAGEKDQGRGAYVCPNADCIKKLKKKRGLDRTFSMKVADEIYDALTALEAADHGDPNGTG